MSKNFRYCTRDDLFNIVLYVWSWKMLRKVVS